MSVMDRIAHAIAAGGLTLILLPLSGCVDQATPMHGQADGHEGAMPGGADVEAAGEPHADTDRPEEEAAVPERDYDDVEGSTRVQAPWTGSIQWYLSSSPGDTAPDVAADAIMWGLRAWSDRFAVDFIQVDDPDQADWLIGEAPFDGPDGALGQLLELDDDRISLQLDNAEWWTVLEQGGRPRIARVVAHLAGHALGLGHVDADGALMHPSYSAGRAELMPADIAAGAGLMLLRPWLLPVPGGRYAFPLSGEGEGEGQGEDTAPQRVIELAPFVFDHHPVTNAQWAWCIEDGACPTDRRQDSATRPAYASDPRFSNHPVVHVDWFDARAYCRWRGLDLPTEAQFEAAALGDDGRRFPWGDETPTCQQAIFARGPDGACRDEPSAGGERASDTHRIAQSAANIGPFGHIDLAGNIASWTSSDFAPHWPPADGAAEGFEGRTLRGGGFAAIEAADIRPGRRHGRAPHEASPAVGFRCASMPEPE